MFYTQLKGWLNRPKSSERLSSPPAPLLANQAANRAAVPAGEMSPSCASHPLGQSQQSFGCRPD
eukprot:5913947-Pyramimonas_sp.AAC.1